MLEGQSYKTLLEGLATCRTLKHLTFAHTGFVELHETLDRFAKFKSLSAQGPTQG